MVSATVRVSLENSVETPFETEDEPVASPNLRAVREPNNETELNTGFPENQNVQWYRIGPKSSSLRLKMGQGGR